MRIDLVVVLCLISAAMGAGIEHYFVEAAAAPQSKLPEAAETSASAPSGLANDSEVLGDRVRCDVRFGELHLPDSAYRAFFDHCVGKSGD
jgi:hypothetical protein